MFIIRSIGKKAKRPQKRKIEEKLTKLSTALAYLARWLEHWPMDRKL